MAARAPDRKALAAGFGLYVHVPFCTTRCDYCAFATWTGREGTIDRYVDALCLELGAARREEGWRDPDTVFFGGGTPSLLSVGHFERILALASPARSAEITVECNPESTGAVLVAGLAALGVNRISLGVQSRRAHVLAGLGRREAAGSYERAVAALGQAGIADYNVDLVYGGAGETTADFLTGLAEVLAAPHAPTHVSAYALTVEPGTPLARHPERHPDEDRQAERYERADELLEAAGYRWYEISNWAHPGAECRHNLSCWLGGEYRGIGCAAHSHVGGERFANVVALDRYLVAVERGGRARARSERLGASARALELAELELRTRFGVARALLDEGPATLGLVVAEGDRYVLTRRGRLLANEVALRLVSPDLEAGLAAG